MVIIGLLAGIVAPSISRRSARATPGGARPDRGTRRALDQYRLDTGRYPTSEQNLAALPQRAERRNPLERPLSEAGCSPGPWGHAYQYRSPGQHGDYDLLSLGSDGQPGGDGESADIVSW